VKNQQRSRERPANYQEAGAAHAPGQLRDANDPVGFSRAFGEDAELGCRDLIPKNTRLGMGYLDMPACSRSADAISTGAVLSTSCSRQRVLLAARGAEE